MILQTWIFFLVPENWLTRKKDGLYYKSTFFQVGEKWFCKLEFCSGSRKEVEQKKKSEFEETLFYTFLENWLQIKWLNGILFPKLL